MRVLLREKRLKLGFTQSDIARLTNIARTTYTNIELGFKNPSLEVAIRIKKVLKEEKDEIFLQANVPKGN